MAAKKTTAVAEAEPKTNTLDSFKENMIMLGNELIEQVRGKQVSDINETISKVVDIYNSVK